MGKDLKRTAKSGKRGLVLRGIALILALTLAVFLWKQFVYIEGDYIPAEDTARSFRTALSLSPFSLPQFEQGYSFRVGNQTASTPEELQQLYRELGSAEMFVRIATKRHVTGEDITDGRPDSNAKELADKVRYFKEDEKGVAAMCKVMEDMRNEAARDGAKKADERRVFADIQSVMESFGVTIEKAMKALKIPVAQWDRYAGLVGKKTQ